MKYDGSNPLHVQQARAKLEKLIKEQKVFELTEKKPQRSLNQNKYLHVCLAYFGCQVGETMEYVKRNYYKILCNKDTFVREREDKFLGRIKYLRSSSDLDSTEFSLTIERFRNFSSAQCGIYIPSPDEERLIQLMEIEVEQSKFHLNMKLTLTKQEVLLIQLLLHIYKNELPDDGTEKHGRFVGKLYKKIKRQVINQLKQ